MNRSVITLVWHVMRCTGKLFVSLVFMAWACLAIGIAGHVLNCIGLPGNWHSWSRAGDEIL